MESPFLISRYDGGVLTALALLALRPSFVDLDATFFAGRLPAVKVETAPGKSTYFMVDTGAPISLNIPPLGEGRRGVTLKIGDESIVAPSHPGEEIAGRFEGMVSPVAGAKIEGVLGTEFLKDKQVLLDPYHGRVALRTGGALDASDAERLLRQADPYQSGRETAKLSLESFDRGFYATRLRIAGKTMRLLLDTGSPFFSLKRSLNETVGGLTVGGVDPNPSSSSQRLWLLPKLQLGSTRLPLQISVDCPYDELDGVVGLTYLARTTIVDLPGKALYYLQPARPLELVDAALARIIGVPLFRTPSGKLAIDLGTFTGIVPTVGEPMILSSLQNRPIEALYPLVERAVSGDSKAIAEVAVICRSRWDKPVLGVSQGGRDLTLTFGIF